MLSSHEWHNTISSRPGAVDSTVFSAGAGTYDGHDVVAGTQALMPALEAWLGDLERASSGRLHLAIIGERRRRRALPHARISA